METYEVDSCIRGHHVYKSIWNPTIGEKLVCERERGNPQDPYAVAVKRRQTTIDHVPRKISAACAIFLSRNGVIDCTVTRARRYSEDLPQGGLMVPRTLSFTGQPNNIAKVRKLVCTPSLLAYPAKKRRTESDVVDVDKLGIPDSTTHKSWLALGGVELSQADKLTNVSGEQLTDKHVNFAQELLKTQFKNVGGLRPTYLLSTLENAPYQRTSVLQMLHCRDNHWITAASESDSPSVRVFDSVFLTLDGVTTNLLRQLFGPNTAICVEESRKQHGGSDCGLYAIATITSLANGCEPGCFIQDEMRAHLVKCFEKLHLTVFPYEY